MEICWMVEYGCKFHIHRLCRIYVHVLLGCWWMTFTDVFSCELKIPLRLWCIHCVRTILSPGCAIPSLIFHYQCVCSCVCIWCWLLCWCACELEWVLCEEAKCSNDRNAFKFLGGWVDRVTDWCVTGPGFTPRRVQLWIKNCFMYFTNCWFFQ